jgi:ketosteroid isomerase-like protein
MMRRTTDWKKRSTRRCAVALGVALFVSLAGGGVSKARRKTESKAQLTESEAIELQKKFQAASIAADIPAVSALMADDAIFIHGSAIAQTKREFLNSLQSGQLKLTTYELKDAKVVLFNGGAIVSGPTEVVLAPGILGPEPFRVEMRVSSVWVATRSGWQVILVQGTPIQGPSQAPAQNGAAR